jgi:hypothetical protein
MSGFNQKGPFEQGPMTGRRMGKCTNYGASIPKAISKESNESNADEMPQYGRRFRCRRERGNGFGQRNRFRGNNQ